MTDTKTTSATTRPGSVVYVEDGKSPPTVLARAPAVLAAISAVASDLSAAGISKDRRNQQQNYAFRGVEDVYQALSPLLPKHGIVILPVVESREETVREAKSGGAIYSVSVRMLFRIRSVADGSYVEVVTYGEAMDSADKATNKAMSAAYKYMAFQTFCIPVQGVEDADAETPPPSAPKAATKPVTMKVAADVKVEPPGPPRAFDLAEEAVAAIARSESLLSLELVAARIAASNFKGSDLASAKQAYADRKKQLEAKK